MGISVSCWNVFNRTNQLKKSYIKNCWNKEPAPSLQLTRSFAYILVLKILNYQLKREQEVESKIVTIKVVPTYRSNTLFIMLNKLRARSVSNSRSSVRIIKSSL